MKHDWGDESVKWTEADLQMGVGFVLRQLEEKGRLTWAADMNAEGRSVRRGARLKHQGMRAGEPDIRVYLPEGRLLLIELKRAKGTLSRDQSERHATLDKFGHPVATVKGLCPRHCARSVLDLLVERGVSDAGVEVSPVKLRHSK